MNLKARSCVNCIFITLCCLFMFQVGAQEIRVITEKEELYLEIAGNESFDEIVEHVSRMNGGGSEEYLIAFAKSKSKEQRSEDYDRAVQNRGRSLGYPREYYSLVLPQEKMDVHFIVTTLANKSLLTLAVARNDLEEAGDRIDHVHPLRFLHTIFTDEELKVAIKNIRSRGWVWNNFMNGLKSSLSTEYAINNITTEHVRDFAAEVKVAPHLLNSVVDAQQWDKFVDLLIRHVPRSGDPGRYD